MNKIIPWIKGKHHSFETRKKISESSTGKIHSEKDKIKMSEAQMGIKNHNFGKHCSEATKLKMSLHQKDFSGKNHPNWQGGISILPYSVSWTETLRKSIRERDKYTCQICGKEPSVIVHHIDYIKTNCNPTNLITLCHSCHIKTNYERSSWVVYFKEIFK